MPGTVFATVSMSLDADGVALDLVSAEASPRG